MLYTEKTCKFRKVEILTLANPIKEDHYKALKKIMPDLKDCYMKNNVVLFYLFLIYCLADICQMATGSIFVTNL